MSMFANTLAIAPNISTSFQATGGTAPYIYSVQSNGAGGTINSSTGVYTAPSSLNVTPSLNVDTIQAVDSLSNIVTLQIKICSPLQLLCDVIQTYMGLGSDQVYLWNQKFNIPSDGRLYIAIGVAGVKPFGSSNIADGYGNTIQAVNCRALLDVFIFSRSTLARDQKEQVVLALNSQYAESQMEANCFYISPLTTEFSNISEIDGGAIPYKFHMTIAVQYFVTNKLAEPYFTTFAQPTVVTNP